MQAAQRRGSSFALILYYAGHFMTVMLILFQSCRDDYPQAEDYRNRYTGTYKGKKICTFNSINPPVTYQSFNDTISITVIKHPDYIDKIIVSADTIPIDRNGFHESYDGPNGYKYFSVSFSGGHIKINTFSGGLGGGNTCETSGTK